MDRRPPLGRFAHTANGEPAIDAMFDDAALARAFVAGEVDASGAAPGYESGTLARAFALIVVCLLVPASLVPFAFDLAAGQGAWWQSLGWRATSTEDVLVNWLVYVPVGVAVCAALRGRVGWFVGGFLAVTFGSGLSVLIEMLQAGMPQRVASWTDVSLNAAGTISGVVIAPAVVWMWTRLAHRIGAGMALRPMTMSAGLLAFGLLALDLSPFDFVTSTKSLHESLMQSEWWVMPWPQTAGNGATWFGVLGAAVGGVLLFVVLGFLAALGGRERGLDRATAWDAAVGHGVVLALLVELLQIFLTSATFSFGELLLHGAAAFLGAYTAIHLVDAPSDSTWLAHRSAVLRPLLKPLLIAQIVCLLMPPLARPWHGSGDTLAGAVTWVPFATQFWMSFPRAMDQIGSTMVAFALLALTAAFALRRDDGEPSWNAAFAVAVAVALIIEGIRCLNPTVSADVSGLILAVLAVEGTSRLVEALRYRVAMAAQPVRPVETFAAQVTSA